MKLTGKIITLTLSLGILVSSCFCGTISATAETKSKMLADVNTDNVVNMKDVLALRKNLANLPTDFDADNADLDYDYTINTKDLLLLRKVLAGMIDIKDLYTPDRGQNNFLKNSAYSLVWSDEFNGTALDTDTWQYEIGFIRNNEPQYYTNNSRNIAVENGHLRLTALKKVYQSAKYTSASINTKGKKSFMYGAIEMRAKLPSTANNDATASWPAFWMMGEKSYWPYCGETDILEMYGQNMKKYEANVHWSNENLDGNGYQNLWKTQGFVPTMNYTEDLGDGWHTYGVEWDEKQMRFYMDNQTLGTVDITPETMSELHQNNFILLNLALQPGQISNSTADNFPIDYLVDYVRVFQKKAD